MDYSGLTFEDDKLGRKTIIQNLMNVIENWYSTSHENESITFSLAASWGSGKSYLLNMWRNWLLSNENKT